MTPSSRPAIVEYGAALNGGGARRLGLDLGGVSILVEPKGIENQKAARQAAERIADAEQDAASFRLAVDGLTAANETFAKRIRDLQKRVSELETINKAAVAGRRRFFGPVLLKPATPGDWSGAVWLLDPEKQERGHALRFSSVAEVRALHPELWVVSATADGILLDAWGEPEPKKTYAPPAVKTVPGGDR